MTLNTILNAISRRKGPFALVDDDTDFLWGQVQLLKWVAWLPMLLFTPDNKKKKS